MIFGTSGSSIYNIIPCFLSGCLCIYSDPHGQVNNTIIIKTPLSISQTLMSVQPLTISVLSMLVVLTSKVATDANVPNITEPAVSQVSVKRL